MSKIRIQAQDDIAQFLETEAGKLEAFYKALEQLEPFIQEFGPNNNKDAQLESLFPDKPYNKPPGMTDEQWWAIQDDWAETPRGELWFSLYNSLNWDFPVFDNLSSTQESVAQLIKRIRQILATGL